MVRICRARAVPSSWVIVRPGIKRRLAPQTSTFPSELRLPWLSLSFLCYTLEILLNIFISKCSPYFLNCQVIFLLLLGVGSYLKSKNPNIKVVLADPEVIQQCCCWCNTCIVLFEQCWVIQLTGKCVTWACRNPIRTFGIMNTLEMREDIGQASRLLLTWNLCPLL